MKEISTEKIKELRKSKKLTQEDLAKELGVSRQTVFSIETGRSEPSLPLAIKICNLFDAAIDELFSDFFEYDSISPTIFSPRKEVNIVDRSMLPLSPISELTGLHREIDRFFEDTLTAPKQNAGLGALNIKDAGNHFAVQVAVPGFTQDEIEIEVGQDSLTLRGEKKEQEKEDEQGWMRREFSYGKFERSVVFPSELQSEKVEATIKHGTLYITLPKVAPTKPKVTKVKVKSS